MPHSLLCGFLLSWMKVWSFIHIHVTTTFEHPCSSNYMDVIFSTLELQTLAISYNALKAEFNVALGRIAVSASSTVGW